MEDNKIMNKVDYDNPNDPDVPTTPGYVITNCVQFTRAITTAKDAPNIFIWRNGCHEQMEARLEELGWELKRKRPWKK